MKKLFLFALLIFVNNVCFGYFQDRINKDISSLKRKGIKQMIVVEEGCYFFKKSAVDYAIMNANFSFLLYKYNGSNYIVVYYIKKRKMHRNGPSEPIIGTKKFEGFESALLWSFYDTCKVFEPKCKDYKAVIDDGCSSIISYYSDEKISSFYISADMYTYCPESPYIAFVNHVFDSIKKFVFESNRFDVKVKCY